MEVAREGQGSSEKLVGGGQQAVEERELGRGRATWAAMLKPGRCPLMPNGATQQVGLVTPLGSGRDMQVMGTLSSFRCGAFS